ncbi:MAG: SpoIVB peptidase S55 domain-containing protein [Bacillota bacterium]
MHRKTILLPLTVLLLFFLISLPLAAETLSFNDLAPGQQGTGRTVFRGTQIEEFDFEIVDLLRNYEPNRNFILVELQGENIERSGGVASGMSGSPLFIEEKLIGAISYGWFQGDNRYVLATPIEEMLAILETDEDYEIGGMEELPELSTPLIINGLSGRRFDRVKADLQDYIASDFQVVPGGDDTYPEDEYYPELEPGSSVAVQLARGDINIASIGTLTYRKDGQVLAFGHPFTNRGGVNFFLSQSHVSTIITGDEPFKLGSPVRMPVGIIHQDRGAGVGGKLDVFPDVVPVQLNILDKDRDKETQMEVQIINDEDLLNSLVPNISLQAIDSGLDRLGSGWASTKIEIMGNNLPGFSIERENVYYSRNDIASKSLEELQELIQLINYNPFQEVRLLDINVSIEVEDKARVALIEEVEILNEDKIYPGDELDLRVVLRPYREETFELDVTLDLPDDIEPGPTSISAITGADFSYYYSGISELEEDTLSTTAGSYTNLEEMLTDYLDTPQNNDLVLEVYPGYPAAPEYPGEEDGETLPNKNEENIEEDEKERPPVEDKVGEPAVEAVPEEDPLREVITTDYVLEGNLYLDFMIEDPNYDGEEQDQSNAERNRNYMNQYNAITNSALRGRK